METKAYEGKYKRKLAIDASNCKNCQKSFKSLLQHLGKQPKCKLAYSDKDLKDLQTLTKSISDSKEKMRKKEYYQDNKEQILQKRESYVRRKNQESSDEEYEERLQKKKKEYYEKNKQRFAEMRNLKLLSTNDSKSEIDVERRSHHCKLCSRTFMKQGSLVDHIHKDHKNYPEDDVNKLQKEIFEKKKIREREYYKKNKEDILKKNKKKYEENKEHILDIKKSSYWNNKDDYVATRANYYKKNREILLPKNKEYYWQNKEGISSKRKEWYQQGKKQYFEEQAQSELQELHVRSVGWLNRYEETARDINRCEGRFMKNTRMKHIQKLKLNINSENIKEKLVELEQTIIDKYNSFEKEVDNIKEDVNEYEKEVFETEEILWEKLKIIERKFHQLYKTITTKDEPETPDRIMNEWKKVQDKVDEELVSISLEFNQPLSYGVKCHSDFHSRENSNWPCYCFKSKELQKTWEEYLQVGKLTSEMKSNVVIMYYNRWSYVKKVREVDFTTAEFDLEIGI